MVHPYINAGSGFYCLGCTMSYSRCLSLSALLASTFITPVAAMDLTLLSPNNNAILEYTHTNTPIPEPASSSFSEQAYKIAAICFLGVGDCDNEISYGKGGEDYTIDTAAQCKNEGFILNNCNSVQVPEGYCPYNKSYITRCKCTSNLATCSAGQIGVGESCGGKYASCKCDPALVSCASNQVGQGASCGGKYQSCVCKSEYIYNSSNCTSPRSVSGASCGGKYTGCSCPSGVSSGSYGCEEYYASPCSSVCKKAYADNCRNRTAVSTPYGCAEYWADCSSKCERAYTDNCRNRTAANCSYGCQSYWSDCSSKCQTCYADNCRNRTAANCSYGCQSYWSDCSSKCQTCYADNCRNRTAVSTPYGCKSYFADCPSKCQTGYTACEVRTAASCPYGCSSYWSDCSSKCQTCYADNCRNRTAANCSYGCKSYWSDCSSKCQICYTDNCRNRTAVISSCPANATCSYFSDCSSKISSWSCKSGYTLSGNTCAADGCKIGYIYYTDGKCLPAANHDSGKTVLGIVVHTTDNGKHGQIMAPWPIDTNGNKTSSNSTTIIWGGYGTDIASLPNFTSYSSASTDYDSCGNTDKIVAQGNASTYPAAWAARKYAPTTDTAGKWCLPAAGIMTNISNKQGAIETAISKVGGVSYPSCCNWSSSEYDSTWAWFSNLEISYGLYRYVKYKTYPVRPVLEF